MLLHLILTLPSRTRPGTPLSYRLPQPTAVLLRPGMRRALSPWKSICTDPGTGTAGPSARSSHGPLAGSIPAKREAHEDTVGQLARHYMPSHPHSDLAAWLMTALDLRATPQVPAIDLP